jgi:DNA-binding MarR family transcriptional regulator
MNDLNTSLDNPLIGNSVTPGTSVAMHVSQRLAKLTISEFERLIKENSELTLASWRVLLALHQMGSSSQKEVVQFCYLDQGQVSRALRFLEDKHFVSSGESLQDRRSRVFSITPEGEVYRQNLQPKIDEFHQRLTNALTEEEIQIYSAIALKIADAAMNNTGK